MMGRVLFAVCLMAAVGLMGLLAGSGLQPQSMSEQAARGLVVWRANGCESCHTIYGMGGNYGPDLTHIADQRGESYLREFFVNPNAFHPNQRIMPRLSLTRDEVTSLIALLQHAGGDMGDGTTVALAWPPHPIQVSGGLSVAAAPPPVVAAVEAGAQTQIEAGQVLFGQNCASCHSLGRDVVIVGPSLWGIADRGWYRIPGQSPQQYIRNSVLNPSEYVVEGFQDVMQKNLGERLSTDDLDALVAFLMQYTEERS